MASDIKRFNSKGSAITERQRSTRPAAAQNPQPIRARKSESGGVDGPGVRVTNPAYGGNATRSKRRTVSLGMQGIGQRGRGLDPA